MVAEHVTEVQRGDVEALAACHQDVLGFGVRIGADDFHFAKTVDNQCQLGRKANANSRVYFLSGRGGRSKKTRLNLDVD